MRHNSKKEHYVDYLKSKYIKNTSQPYDNNT